MSSDQQSNCQKINNVIPTFTAKESDDATAPAKTPGVLAPCHLAGQQLE